MSYAATHRQHHHIHMPWPTIVVVAAAVAVAAGVLVLVNLPATTVVGNSTGAVHHAGRVHRVIPSTSTAVAPVSIEAAAVAVPETTAFRRHLATDISSRAAQSEQFAYPRNHVMGTTLGATAAQSFAAGGTTSQMAPNDPHPLNHFPGEP